MPARQAAAKNAVAAARPRTLVLGAPPGILESSLGLALDLGHTTLAEACAALEGQAADALLLDGNLPADHLAEILERVGPPGRAGRPAVIVVTDGGQRTQVEARLVEHADDFVNGALGSEVLLARVRTALRLKSLLDELSRKNDELGRLYARMQEELRLAAHMQRSLLPPPLDHPRIEVAREFLPFRELGGDFFDLLPLSASRLAFGIGDVMGKGVSAALVAANLKACLRAQLQAADAPAAELVARVNRLFHEITPKGLFATLFFGLFDLEQGVLEYANAGHDYPFLLGSDGVAQDLMEGGTVLGLVADAGYQTGSVALAPDDVLVFYSDGLTDRMNAAGEAFCAWRLKEAASRNRSHGARILLYALLGEVQGWSAGTCAEDDMTLVVARVR